MKLLILGHGRHGKDTVAEMLNTYYGLTFMSSSEWIAHNVVYPIALRHGYTGSAEELYEHRHDSSRPFCGREFWFTNALQYNITHGGAAIARGVLSKADVYVGMRSRFEFEAAMAENLFDVVLWVSRERHLPPEGDSMELTREDASIFIDNNGTMRDLFYEVDRVATELLRRDF